MSTASWDNIPDGCYTIRALGQDRAVTVRRVVIVEMDLGEPEPTVLPQHLADQAAVKIAALVQRADGAE